jgi:hypothetical protein
MVAAATGQGSMFILIPWSECPFLNKTARTQAADRQYGLQKWIWEYNGHADGRKEGPQALILGEGQTIPHSTK